MTNQIVVAPVVKSRANKFVELAVSISNSTLLPRAPVPESMALLSGFLGQYQKRLLFMEDGGGKGGAKVNPWVESMRASSPTRVKSSTVSGSENQDKNPWIVSITNTRPFNCESDIFHGYGDLTLFCFSKLFLQLRHPSALNMFDEMICNSKGKQIVTFLDYDGTLSPIVADPDKAFMSKKVTVWFSHLLFFFNSNQFFNHYCYFNSFLTGDQCIN